MIEQSVMDHQELIKDQQVGTSTAEDSSKTEAVIVVVKSAEADQRGGVEKSEETEFETSKEEEEVSDVDNDLKSNLVHEEEPEPPQNCVIDVKCVGKLEEEEEEENCDVEKVCRICHLSGDPPSENSDMIQLGCGCKDELGIAHRHCAETWFKLKGNRCCEICGEAAKNITGMWDDRFMEDWNDRRSVGSNSLDTRWGFWRGQPFCNFLMACLVMAFVLPWFFRVNMF